MRTELGRSMIEMIGVLAISGIMLAGTYEIAKNVNQNRKRIVATETLKDIASDTKTLMEMRGSYDGVSVEYLIKSGALKSDKSPLGGNRWSVESGTDGKSFSINLTDVSKADCAYFAQSVPSWTNGVIINGYDTDLASHCFSSESNQISFVIE